MRVSLLTNFIAPYRVTLLERLRDRVGALSVLLSTPMERDREWAPAWGTLDVRVQRTLTIRRDKGYTGGFARRLEIHVPWDTLPLLAGSRPDAVISGELGMRSLQAALYRLTRRRMPLLIWATLSEHSERDWGWMRRTLRRFILACADGVFVNGESGARYVAGFGVPDGRIFRLNQPVDVEIFAREPRTRTQDNVIRLLCAGVITARKGLEPFAQLLIDWADRHPEQSIELWWVGDGDRRAALQALALPPNLRFRFLGHVSYDQLPSVYAQVDLFAFPTLLDEWGLVVNEAMAAGLPVLGSIYSQAVEELVSENQTGWIYDPHDRSAAELALGRALGVSAGRRAEMGQLARARILPLTPDAQAARIAEAIWLVAADLRQSSSRKDKPRPVVQNRSGS